MSGRVVRQAGSCVNFDDSTLTQISRVRVESAVKLRDMSRIRVESS